MGEAAAGLLSERLALLDIVGADVAGLESAVCNEAVALFEFDRAVIWRYSNTLGTLFSEHEGEFRGMSVSQSASAELFERAHLWPGGDMEIVRRVAESSFGVGADRPDRSYALLPLAGGGPLSRLLAIESSKELAAEDVERRLSVFGRQANVLLSTFDALDRSRRNEVHLEALNRTASEIASVLELENVLAAITERARELVGAPIAYLLLVDEEQGEVVMRIAQGVSSAAFLGLRLAIGEGVGGRVARQLEPFYTTDYLNDTRFDHDPHVDEVVRAEGIKSILSLPMHVFGKLVGVMHVADSSSRAFDADEIDVLLGLARHAALAIRNAALYDGAQRALLALEESNQAVREQNERLERAQSVHRQLSEIVLAGHGLAGAIRLMAKALDVTVCILNDANRPLETGGVPTDEFARRLFERGIAERGVPRASVQEALDKLDVLEVARLSASPPTRLSSWIAMPIVASGHLLGSMWVESADERIDQETDLLEQAVRVLGLELLREQSVAEVSRRLRRELIDELLSPHAAGGTDLVRRAQDHGFDLRSPHHLMVIFGVPDSGVVAERMRERILEAVRSYPFTDIAADRGGVIVALLAESAKGHEKVESLLDAARDDLGLVAVISAPCTAPRDYRSAYAIAERIARLFPPRRRRLTILPLEHARLLGLIFREGGESECREFVDAVLGPLDTLQAEQRDELVRTLDAYVAADRRPARTAKALHVHVNTVYYRLKQLESLLGPAFGSPDKMLDLRVALLARRLLNDDS